MHYEYEVSGHGCIVTSPDGETVWLQGDDADYLMSQAEQIEALWIAWEFKAPESHVFESFEDHLDALLDGYFA